MPFFLSADQPVRADILVVEGWLPDYALKKAAQEFKDGRYGLLVTTGGPLEQGSFLAQYNTYAELAYNTFIKMGLNRDKLAFVPALLTKKGRTHSSAVSLREWLERSGNASKRINLVSLGPHSRRSYSIFDAVLGPGADIGIIAIPPEEYDYSSWWTNSAGARTVLGEAIAYFYVLVFNP